MRGMVYRLVFWRFIQLIKGQKIYDYMKGLDSYYKADFKSQEEYKLESLKKLLTHCQRNVPYYTGLFKRIDFNPSEVECLDDLKSLPVLTKDIVRENFQDFISTDIDSNYVTNSTSGSTGINLSLMISSQASERWYASKLYWRNSHGVNVGEKILWVWGRKIGSRNRVMTFLKKHLEGEYKFSAFSLSQSQANEIATTINRKYIRMIYGYTSAVYHLATFLEGKGCSFPSLKLIVVTAEGITDSQRMLIEKVFQCKVISEYGAAEMGILSYECSVGNRHEVGFNNIIELEKPHDRNNYNSIIVTDLFNYKMPLLRYNSGDLTSTRDWVECECGINSWVIGPIQGRKYDMIRLNDGKIVHGEAINYIVKHTYMPKYIGILHTFIQEDINRFMLKIYSNYDVEELKDLESTFEEQLSLVLNMEVSLRFIYRVSSDYSYQGKHRFIVSKVK